MVLTEEGPGAIWGLFLGRWSRYLGNEQGTTMARHPLNTRYERAKLSDYPTDVVTIECATCPARFGRYRLGSLVKRMGPDALLDDVFDDLVTCTWKRAPWERPPRKYEPRCIARFMEWRG